MSKLKIIMRVIIVFLFAIFLILPLQAFSSDEIIAKVGDRIITKSDIERIIAYYPDVQQKRILGNPIMQREVLERYIQGIVVSRLAMAKGFDKQENIRERLELMANDFLANQYIQQEVIGKIEITESEAKEYYNKYKEEFISPEMVKARHILIKSEKNRPANERKAARDKAEALLNRIKKGEDFAKLAMEFSEDAGSKSKGGELDFFHRGMMVPEFEKSAFSLKPGQISAVVETPFGYHIIRMEESKDAWQPSFHEINEKVKAKARDRLKDSKRNEFINKALKDAGVEIRYDALKK